MRINSFFIVFVIIVGASSVFAQNTVGTTLNTESSYDAYTLFTLKNTTYLINNCGQVINTWSSDFTPGFSVYLLPDGNLLRAEFNDNSGPFIPGKGGRVAISDWNSNIIWHYDFSSSLTTQHHDICPLPNGNILVLLVEVKTESQALFAGRNPNNLVEGSLFSEKIIEVRPVGENDVEVVWEWNIWDHLIQDFDDTKTNYGDVLHNPQLLDINYLGFSEGKENWLHVNSIQYNEDLDQIVISTRQLNEIYIIDHATSKQEAASHSGGEREKGGDFLYRWGNPLAYKAGTVEDQKLYGQHFPNWIEKGFSDEGKIMIFNNGFGRDTEFSSVNIIDPPQTNPGDYIINSGEKIGPANFDWTYIDPDDPLNFFSKIMSSAQRLPNGNTLICEGTEGHFFEIDKNKIIVWNYVVPISQDGILSQGDAPDPSRFFRAYKYAPENPAFDGKDMSSGDPIEHNFNINECLSLDVEEVEVSEFHIYPNPVKESLHIISALQIYKLELYNVQGIKIKKVLNQSTLYVSDLTSGMYILRVYSENKISSKKIIIE